MASPRGFQPPGEETGVPSGPTDRVVGLSPSSDYPVPHRGHPSVFPQSLTSVCPGSLK